jgi:hypothetical protein
MMAAPNYKHAKKQREAAQKKKNQQKEQKKAERKGEVEPAPGGTRPF